MGPWQLIWPSVYLDEIHDPPALGELHHKSQYDWLSPKMYWTRKRVRRPSGPQTWPRLTWAHKNSASAIHTLLPEESTNHSACLGRSLQLNYVRLQKISKRIPHRCENASSSVPDSAGSKNIESDRHCLESRGGPMSSQSGPLRVTISDSIRWRLGISVSLVSHMHPWDLHSALSRALRADPLTTCSRLHLYAQPLGLAEGSDLYCISFRFKSEPDFTMLTETFQNNFESCQDCLVPFGVAILCRFAGSALIDNLGQDPHGSSTANVWQLLVPKSTLPWFSNW